MNKENVIGINNYWFEVSFDNEPEKIYCFTHDFLIKLYNGGKGLYDRIITLNYCDESSSNPNMQTNEHYNKMDIYFYDNKIYNRKIKFPKSLKNFNCRYAFFE